MPDWRAQLGELSRVAGPDGVILHEWGNGAPHLAWVRYREELRARLASAGLVDVFHPGSRTEAEIEAELDALGWRRVAEIPSGPGTPMTLGAFIDMVETGETSYLWEVPDAVRAELLPGLRVWARSELGGLDQPIEVPGEAHWRIYRRA